MHKYPLIGILGGTFDPIHCGHLQIAAALLENLPFNEIRFVPCKMPVHRGIPAASAADRAAMIELAIANKDKFILDLREIKRKTPSYMIETLQTLRQDFKNESLALLLGSDAFYSMHTWKNWRDYLNYAHLVVINRSPAPLTIASEIQSLVDNFTTVDKEKITILPAGCIYFVQIEPILISGTNIRKNLSEGLPTSEFLPHDVLTYIQKHRLYRSDPQLCLT